MQNQAGQTPAAPTMIAPSTHGASAAQRRSGGGSKAQAITLNKLFAQPRRARAKHFPAWASTRKLRSCPRSTMRVNTRCSSSCSNTEHTPRFSCLAITPGWPSLRKPSLPNHQWTTAFACFQQGRQLSSTLSVTLGLRFALAVGACRILRCRARFWADFQRFHLPQPWGTPCRHRAGLNARVHALTCPKADPPPSPQ